MLTITNPGKCVYYYAFLFWFLFFIQKCLYSGHRKQKLLSGIVNQDAEVFCQIRLFNSLPRSPEHMGPETKPLSGWSRG